MECHWQGTPHGQKILKNFRSIWRQTRCLAAGICCLAVGFKAWSGPAPDSVLTNVAQVLSLTPGEADRVHAVRVQGIVTCYFPSVSLLFVQDSTGGCYVGGTEPPDVKVGDSVQVEGFTAAGKHARTMTSARIRRIPALAPVAPKEVPLQLVASGASDSQFVTVRGVVRNMTKPAAGELRFILGEKSQTCEVVLPGVASDALPADLAIDCQARVTGVCVALGDRPQMVTGGQIWARFASDISVEVPAPSEATVPLARIAPLTAGGPSSTPANRVRLNGSVVLARGSEVYFQDETGAILVETAATVKQGDEGEFTGFLEWKASLPKLTQANFILSRSGGGITPIAITAANLVSEKLAYSLVRLTAKVVQQQRKGDLDELVCKGGGIIFTCELLGAPQGALAGYVPDTEVQLTGLVTPQAAAPGGAPAYRLRLRSPEDIVLLNNASWWNVDRVAKALAGAVAFLLVALGWIYWLHRCVARQTELIRAQFEKEATLQARYRDLVQNANDIVYTHDLKGKFTNVNESAQRLLGFGTDELLAMTIERLLTKESAETARAMLEQKIKSGGRTTYPVKVVDKFGRQIDLEVSSWVVYQNDQPSSVQGIARDISARRRDEKALRESEQKYRAVVETSQDLIWSVDARARWTFVNQAARRIYGINPEDLNGRPVAEREAEPNAGVMEKALLNLNGSDSLQFESTHTRIDKSLVLLSFQAMVTRDAKGTVLGLVGSARDITQQKRDQENILRLAAAIEQAAEIVAILDTSGAVQYLNPAFEKITGHRAVEGLEKSFSALIEERSGTPSFLEIAAVIARAGSWSGRLCVRKRDKGLLETEATISSIRDKQKKLINFAAVLRDVSRESNLEEQVRLSQKMEAIGLMAGGVAHDFNNLLQVIDGFAGLAAASVDDPEVCRGNLDKVQSATLRASQMTRQLLAFGRRQTLQMVDADLNELFSEHLHMAGRLIGPQIEVEFLPEPSIANVRVDRGQIEQVLLNLCINARDAMPQGGHLIIELRNVTLDAPAIPPGVEARPGPYVRLSVRDTGTGIDKATLARIFDPFFTTKPKGKGTGLGLSVVYGIIKQHGGFIDVESTPGEGTEFKVYLPVVPRSKAVEVAKTAITVSTGNEFILLAEDEPLVREIASRVLSNAGYTVIPAENGEEAVALFEQNAERIDLLLFDVLMPRLSGPAAYMRISAIRPEIPVLFCSGYAGADPVLEKLMAEGIDLVTKPYTAQMFLERVRHTLDHFSAPRPAGAGAAVS